MQGKRSVDERAAQRIGRPTLGGALATKDLRPPPNRQTATAPSLAGERNVSRRQGEMKRRAGLCRLRTKPYRPAKLQHPSVGKKAAHVRFRTNTQPAGTSPSPMHLRDTTSGGTTSCNISTRSVRNHPSKCSTSSRTADRTTSMSGRPESSCSLLAVLRAGSKSR